MTSSSISWATGAIGARDDAGPELPLPRYTVVGAVVDPVTIAGGLTIAIGVTPVDLTRQLSWRSPPVHDCAQKSEADAESGSQARGDMSEAKHISI